MVEWMVKAARKPVVLCVDDDPEILSSLRRVLRQEPYEVETTDDPRLALKRVAKGDVSLVLVDQRMPYMCGGDFAAEVRRISPNTVRVMLTAYPHHLADEVQWLVGKPWNDEALKLTLLQLLRDRGGPPKESGSKRRPSGGRP
jgi:response regulator RpfG family c-di-GMP phosphodiesterase